MRWKLILMGFKGGYLSPPLEGARFVVCFVRLETQQFMIGFEFGGFTFLHHLG